ncbi:hypothetical protein Zmor_019215 [Zophobas morio]|uniref:Uncharacterized protein n=1 Tax=Zophobas morio TaxID=2755281 RepID=A0AA38M8G8_9CUCU|nr:hypothetical protein Zmor_019215 [Zophobas morio]
MDTNTLWILILCAAMVNGQFDQFPFNFNPTFPDVSSIIRGIEDELKPLQISDNKNRLMQGIGGVTILEAPGKSIIIHDGTSFECRGTVISKQPFCLGFLVKFQTNTPQDYCFSENYDQSDDVLCIAHSSHKALFFNSNNGRLSCSGSNDRPALMISTQEYFALCNRLPWQKTMSYFPDRQSPFHVPLPNPNLGCFENSYDVCTFKPSRQLI